MENLQPENLTSMSPKRSDEIKKGLDIFSRAIQHTEQLPKDFTPSTSFSANLKSLNPSDRCYNVSAEEVREFLASKTPQKELEPS